MNNEVIKTNLQNAASENFNLYPQCYPCYLDGNLRDETREALNALAYGFFANDGFDQYFTLEEVEQIVKKEFLKSVWSAKISNESGYGLSLDNNEAQDAINSIRKCVADNWTGSFDGTIIAEHDENTNEFDVYVMDLGIKEFVGSVPCEL